MAEFARLYERYRGALYHFCVAHIGDAGLAEDIVQDVFLKAFSEFHRFDRNRPFWPWLSAIARRRCIDAHRRGSYAQRRLYDLAAPRRDRDDADTAFLTVLRRLERQEIDAELRTLPDRQRVTLQLFALDGWTYAEIADHLACSVGTVKALIVRARLRLREVHRVPVAAALGGLRAVQRRAQDLVARGQAAFSVAGNTLGSLAQGVPGGLSALALVVAALHSAVTAGGSLGPLRHAAGGAAVAVAGAGDGAHGGRWWPPAAGAGAGEAGPSAAVVAPRAPSRGPGAGSVAAEPATRPHQAAAERTVNEALEPVGLWHRPAPEDSKLHVVAVSPAYEQDRTVFAASSGGELVLTRDGGASWTRPRGLGLKGVVRFLFPPAYPADPRVFVIGRYALQVTRDQGESFETLAVVPWLADAALSPSFHAGDPSILLVSSGTLLEYRDDLGTVAPVRPASSWADDDIVSVRYDPDYASEPTIILMRWSRVTGDLAVSRCVRQDAVGGVPDGRDALACSDTVLGRRTQQSTFRAPTSGSGPMFVPDRVNVYVSLDDGRTFTSRSIRSAGDDEVPQVEDVVVARTPGGYRAVAAISHAARTGADVFASEDGGATWRAVHVGLPRFDWGAIAVAVTPTGRMFALAVRNGLACSADGGQTWAVRCAGPD